jgi:hypothetical protein
MEHAPRLCAAVQAIVLMLCRQLIIMRLLLYQKAYLAESNQI